MPASPPAPTQRARRWWLFDARQGPSALLGAALGVVGFAAAAASPAQASETGPVLCPSRLLTGLPCPGCGLVRGCTYLVHGDVGRALHFNPFSLVVLALVPFLAAVTAAHLARGRSVPALVDALPARLAAAVAGVWIAWGVLRLVLIQAGVLPTIV